ncbi:MAG: hypothetical protein K5644_05805 [Lachnospiraceae bacterium]|nr:hypothetical protein [Lachnospiraceae bacterium]
MDAMIKSTIYDPNVVVFDSYPNISADLKSEIEDWKKRFYDYCDKQTDFAAFATSYYGSDMQVEGSGLLTRAAMEEMGGADKKNDVNSEADVISVRDFLKQYETGYNEIKRAGYRKRGEAAYEKLFDVANRTDNMVEAQIILEKERLLWKIVSEDALDIFDTVLEAMDPLYEATSYPVAAFSEVYKKVDCDEELTYETEILKHEIPKVVSRSTTRIMIAAILGTNILNYAKSKNKIRTWASDRSAKEGLSGMIVARKNICKYLDMLRTQFGWSFNDIINDEFTKLWLLNPRNLDSTGRLKRVLNPANFDAYKEIVDECRSSKSISQILETQSRYVVYFDLDRKDREYTRKAEAFAKEQNSALTYYKYESSLKRELKDKGVAL